MHRWFRKEFFQCCSYFSRVHNVRLNLAIYETDGWDGVCRVSLSVWWDTAGEISISSTKNSRLDRTDKALNFGAISGYSIHSVSYSISL